MRRAKAFLKLGKWRRSLRNLVFLLGSSAALICISTVSNFFFLKFAEPPSTPPPLYPGASALRPSAGAPFLQPRQIKPTLRTLILKIQQEAQNPSVDPFRYRAFLSQISTQLQSIQKSLELGRIPENITNFTDKQSEKIPAQNTNKQSIIPAATAIANNSQLTKPEDYFLMEEIRKYVKMKPNRLKKQNFLGAEGTFTTIGHACFSMREELERYMDYDVGELCNDDWKLGQKLMIRGCDPLPRRRCLAPAPRYYRKPLPISRSLWTLPDDRNVRWSHYKCKSFACLASNSTSPSRKGFHKCAQCFNLAEHERPRWTTPNPSNSIPNSRTTWSSLDFNMDDVLAMKAGGEIRIGLDFSVGTGTFAARMRERNVTVVSAGVNIGAPFSETIALRGLVPLYLTINQRLPFFDNTLDVIHTTRFLDGWIDLVLLDFVLYDWDRVLRPGGLLWVDSFFCLKEDLEDYLKAFRMLRYKRRKWVVAPKTDKGDDREVFFSAVLEKPPRPFW